MSRTDHARPARRPEYSDRVPRRLPAPKPSRRRALLAAIREQMGR